MNRIPEIEFRPGARLSFPGLECIHVSDLHSRVHPPLDHNPFEPHRLDFYAILVVREGIATHHLDFHAYIIHPGECLLISRGQVHSFGNPDEYDGYLLIFTEAFLGKHVAPASLPEIQELYDHFVGVNHCTIPKDDDSFHSLLMELTAARSTPKAGIAGALMTIFLLRLSESCQRNGRTGKQGELFPEFLRFRQLLHLNFQETRDARFYAEALNISYKQLNQLCKQVVHQTAKTFIDKYVMLEAQRQLVATRNSIKEIGFALGFEEPTNFVKYFRKHQALTPGEFRDQHR